MLQIDPANKLSYNHCIAYGDLVIVYEKYSSMKAVEVLENGTLQNRFGLFTHSDWIGKHFGSKVLSREGGFVYLLAPTPELWTLVLSHRTQIVYIADISFVLMYLEIVPGCVVLESGTGSGSLTTSLARAISPNGHIYTFDFHEQRAASASEDFRRTGLSSLVTIRVRDIQGEGFPDDFIGQADSVFLDLPQPWLAIPSAAKMLKQDGVLCSFSPCIEQVQRSCETLRIDFTDIRTFEVLLHTYEVREAFLENWQDNEGGSKALKSCKKRQRSENGVENTSPRTIMAKRNDEARGHTEFLSCRNLASKIDLYSGTIFISLTQERGEKHWKLCIMGSYALALSPSKSFPNSFQKFNFRFRTVFHRSFLKSDHYLSHGCCFSSPSTSSSNNVSSSGEFASQRLLHEFRVRSAAEGMNEAADTDEMIRVVQLGSMFAT